MITEEQLRHYGVTGGIRRLTDAPAPELIDYLDLLEPRRPHRLLPHAVAENLGKPLLFFVDESHPGRSFNHDYGVTELRRVLACRGDRAYLARVSPGELKVIPVSLDEQTPEWRVYRAGSSEALSFFSRLVRGYYDGPGEVVGADFVFKHMFDLLEHVADRLAQMLPRADVLSLVGRALFFRFLHDRRIVTEEDRYVIAPTAPTIFSCFDSASAAAASCKWLDRTFNGDFLPLTDNGSYEFFDKIARNTRGEVFNHLGAIIRSDEPADEQQYQLRFNWGDFDFAHIPVGLLSQVYEAFCWKWDHDTARKTSIYYTPRNIAATLVDEAFHDVVSANHSRVLDPACGAGVFLVLAFRRLYREQWQTNGVRPDTKAIREILDGQLTGFDISDSALKLAALSLYLTAVELDPKPVPPERLKFNELRNRVLFNFRLPDEPTDGMVIGSLGSSVVSTRFDNQFDVVLSNPPWTRLNKDEKILADQLTSVSQEVVARKAEPSAAQGYRNPDHAPDLPFLWKATDWCKDGGRIAMALPARIILKQEQIPSLARSILLRTIEVSGIINGSNLSDTNVWPGMQQPFMLFFARNRTPQPNHAIHFITAHHDTALNELGELHIDFKSAQPVEVQVAEEEPWIWKALTVGTSLDVDVIRQIQSSDGVPLGEYWEQRLNLVSGSGFMLKANQPQFDATFLHGLPLLTEHVRGSFFIDTSTLPTFSHKTAARPRTRELYTAPLVVVKQAPGTYRENAWSLLSFSDVTFNQSFHGYSSATHPMAEFLARYLHLFAHSLVRLYYALITRPRFGAERRVLDKSDFDHCPIIPIENLSASERSEVLRLSDLLLSGEPAVFESIDWFFGRLYGLTKVDLEVIRDTLSVCLPYKSSRDRACIPPTPSERDTFRRRLQSLLHPFFSAIGKQASVMEVKNDFEAPFCALSITSNPSIAVLPEIFENQILPIANETSSTRVIVETRDSLIIGILNQYRYWTPSRARLLASEILRQHMSVFESS